VAPVTASVFSFATSLVFDRSAGVGSHQLISGLSTWKVAGVSSTARSCSDVTLRVHTGITGRFSSATK